VLALRIVDFALTTQSGLTEALDAEYKPAVAISAKPVAEFLQTALFECIEAFAGAMGDAAATPAGKAALWPEDVMLHALLVHGKLLLRACTRAIAAPVTEDGTHEAKAEAIAETVDGLVRFFTWGSETLGSFLSTVRFQSDIPGEVVQRAVTLIIHRCSIRVQEAEAAAPPPAVTSACQLVLALAAETHALGIASHGRCSHFHAPLAISSVIIHTTQEGGRGNDSTARG
jgi:hypothetical protein